MASRPKLLLTVSYFAWGNFEAFLICNGYKDEEYVALALLTCNLDLNTMIVLEEELDTIVETS